MEKATNGQFREFVGKLLVKGSDERVASIDKTKIQNAIDSLSSNDETVFENFITFINNGCHLLIGEFFSKVFRKTTVVTVTKNPKSFKIQEKSVMTFLEPVIKREKELKNPTPYVDNDIWNYFKDKVVPGFLKDFSSTVYRFVVNLTHRQILEEAENLGIKKVYSYMEALSIIRQAILDGEVDKKGTGIIVYFKIEGNDSLYRFYACRRGDGRLKLYVNEVLPDIAWDAGDGACFSN